MKTTTLLLGVALAASTAGSPPQSAAGARKAATFPVSGTAVAVEEGRLTVPANRTSGSAAQLALHFVRFPSTAAHPKSPIVFLAGGPGDAATRAVRGMPVDLLNQLLAIADVIAFDQRGTGLSEPRNALCPPAGSPLLPRDRAGDPVLFLDDLKARARACLAEAARAGVDVMGLTTSESADDLEALRVALGATKLSLLAGSYGTHLALAAAQRHPALVDRMVLAGVEGPDDTIKLPSRVDAVMAAIAAARRPTLLDEVRAITQQLAAHPARHQFPGGQTIVIGAWDVQRWIVDSLDTVPEIEAMVAAIPAMLKGDFSVPGRATLAHRLARPLNLMHLAMDCASYASDQRLARIRREAATALLGDAINFPLPGLCDLAGLPRLPDSFRATVRSDVPALLISGTFDGRTPVQNASDVAAGMPQARTLVIEGASHGLFREKEVSAALVQFFRDPNTRASGFSDPAGTRSSRR